MTAAAPGWEAERLRLVRDALLAKAQRARRDPAEFFEFVMREETTRARLVLAPHQRLLFDFVGHHDRCVVRMPAGASKTYCMTGLSIWNLGEDATSRGVIISAGAEQAKKPLIAVRQYLDDQGGLPTPEIRLVFPKLRKSQRDDDAWTQSKLVVDRPPGIRDASMSAIGYHGKLPGSRLKWILVDDLLDGDNTRLKSARDDMKGWFFSTVIARKDVAGAKIVVVNTPWHTEDLTHALEQGGFPSLTMDIEGGIKINNTDFDSTDIRVAYRVQGHDPRTSGDAVRLVAHDAKEYGAPLCRRGKKVEHFDLEEKVPLWAERWGRKEIDDLRATYAKQGRLRDFEMTYMMRTRSDEESRCKVAYIEKCKLFARDAAVFELAKEYRGQNVTATGVDLGVGLDADNDRTSIVTVELIPQIKIGKRLFRNVRRLLDIESGRWPGGMIIDKILQKQQRFGSVCRVETNAAQDFIRQWALERDASVPVRSHQTGKNKRSREFGIETIFIEMENGAWLLPNEDGKVAEDVQTLIDGCLECRQGAHTADELMALWLAREQLRDLAGFSDLGQQETGGDFGASINAR